MVNPGLNSLPIKGKYNNVMNIKHINEEWSANNKMNILLIDNTNLFLTERTRTSKKYSCSTHQFRQKNQNKCNKYFWNIFNKSECNKKRQLTMLWSQATSVFLWFFCRPAFGLCFAIYYVLMPPWRLGRSLWQSVLAHPVAGQVLQEKASQREEVTKNIIS